MNNSTEEILKETKRLISTPEGRKSIDEYVKKIEESTKSLRTEVPIDRNLLHEPMTI